MKTAADYLDAIRERHHLNSDRKAAALLGIKNAARLRTGEDAFSDTTAARVAELLDTDPSEILIASHAQRAKTERERALWIALARKAGYAEALGIMLSSQRRRPGYREPNTATPETTNSARNTGLFFARKH